MIRIAIAAFLVLLFVYEADARPRRRRSNNNNYTTSSTTSNYYGGSPQSVASSKAATSASRGIKGHVGGSFGGANAEGVGFSSYSAQSALNNCCYTGQRRVAGSSVVRGRDGWYAVKIYW